MGIIKSISKLFAGGGFLRPGLALVSALLALLVGFVWVAPGAGGDLVMSCGYYYIAAVFLCFVLCLSLRFREAWPELRARLPKAGWVLAILILVSAFIGLGDRVCYKVLFDEHCLQATALHMHQTHQVATITGGLMQDGQFVTTQIFLDKRPYFFAFLVSLLHGLFGTREGNAFLLNLLLLPVLVVATYAVASRLTSRHGGLLAVCLLGTLPILSQCATGAGMDFHNLTMLAVVFWAALSYLEKPEPLRLSLLCLAAVLLAQSRYESALFVVPVAGVVVLGWLRVGRALWSWGALATPLLLVPYAWHHRYLSIVPELWQLRPGQSSRFSLEYLWENLAGAFHFFFSLGTTLPNSPQLSVLGLCSVLVLGFLVLRRLWQRNAFSLSPSRSTLAFFGAAIGLNFVVLQFYYWAKLDDYLACRFSLPLYWWLCLCVPVCLELFTPRRAWLAPLVWLFVLAATVFHTLPTRSLAAYTTTNLAARELEWETSQVAAFDPSQLLVIANKSTIPWVVARVPSLMLNSDAGFWERLRQQRLRGRFSKILVTQIFKADATGTSFVLDKTDTLPPSVRLQTLAELRQKGRIDRLSEVIEIKELEAQPLALPPAAPLQ